MIITNKHYQYEGTLLEPREGVNQQRAICSGRKVEMNKTILRVLPLFTVAFRSQCPCDGVLEIQAGGVLRKLSYLTSHNSSRYQATVPFIRFLNIEKQIV